MLKVVEMMPAIQQALNILGDDKGEPSVAKILLKNKTTKILKKPGKKLEQNSLILLVIIRELNFS